MVIAKLLMVGVGVADFHITETPTVDGLIDAALDNATFENINFDEYEPYRNNVKVDGSTRIFDGDRVTFAKKIKGNVEAFEVEIVRLGNSQVPRVTAVPGSKVGDLLTQLDEQTRSELFNSDGSPAYEWRDNTGRILTPDSVLNQAASGVTRIVMTKKTKGN